MVFLNHAQNFTLPFCVRYPSTFIWIDISRYIFHLDQNKYFIQIIPDVLLHNLDQEPKLTKEEVSECVVRGSYDCKNQSEVSMMMS